MIEIAAMAAEVGESEEECLCRLLEGTCRGDTESRNAFMEEVRRIVDRKYEYFARRNAWLRMECEQGEFTNTVLIEVAQHYAGIRASYGGASIKKYVSSCCYHHFVALLRERIRTHLRRQIDAARVGKWNRSVELKAAVKDALGRLGPAERAVIKARYGIGLADCEYDSSGRATHDGPMDNREADLRAIAKDLGKSYGYVRNLHSRALKKLAPYLDHDDWRRISETQIEPDEMEEGSG